MKKDRADFRIVQRMVGGKIDGFGNVAWVGSAQFTALEGNVGICAEAVRGRSETIASAAERRVCRVGVCNAVALFTADLKREAAFGIGMGFDMYPHPIANPLDFNFVIGDSAVVEHDVAHQKDGAGLV